MHSNVRLKINSMKYARLLVLLLLPSCGLLPTVSVDSLPPGQNSATVRGEANSVIQTTEKVLVESPYNLNFTRSGNAFSTDYYYYRGAFKGVWILGKHYNERIRMTGFIQDIEGHNSSTIEIKAVAEERPKEGWPWVEAESYSLADKHLRRILKEVRTQQSKQQ